jgi:hypothetical protein
VTFEDDFLPLVKPYVRGCPDGLALQHLLDAAREYCERTLVWNFSCLPIKSEAGVARYTLQIAEQQEVSRILALEVNGSDYRVDDGVNGRAAVRRSRSSDAAVFDLGTLDFTLAPAPTLDDMDIVVDVAVMPAQGATEWPDDLRSHVRNITRGAIASLCALPRVDWRDMDTVQMEGARFEDAVATTASRVAKGFGRSRRHSNLVFY